jgi:lysozyme
MVSLAYNLGVDGFSRTAVLERVNARDYAGAADAFLWYDHARVDGELKSIPHLTERRQKERTLFVS